MSTRVLLISTYELGHQPLGLAFPAAHLLSEDIPVDCLDLAVEPLDADRVRRASLIGISAPMHTALRLGILAGERVREINPAAHLCFFGLYATLNADQLLRDRADSIIGDEGEAAWVGLARFLSGECPDLPPGVRTPSGFSAPSPGRQKILPPARRMLPPLSRYAHLESGGILKRVGPVEASRGCAHRCLHCPITPVYEGRFRILHEQLVSEDISTLAGMGAEHITFCDPDFLNGAEHSMRIVRRMHESFPTMTFDMTAKIQHLIEYRTLMPELKRLGCLFIQSAAETLNDAILGYLAKEHTRRDIQEALELTRQSEISLRLSWMPFTPWTRLDDFLEILDWVEREDLIYQVDPVQFSIRLLVPPGSSLLGSPSMKPFLMGFDSERLCHKWENPDSRMRTLEKAVARVVEEDSASGADPAEIFHKIQVATLGLAGLSSRRPKSVTGPLKNNRPPRLTESWFCCAEPTRIQEKSVMEDISGPAALSGS